jgi:toxin ParE1/3/4
VRLRTTSIADADVVDSALWLDREQAGLGSVFVDAVEAVFQSIVTAPLACPTFNLPSVQFKSSLRSKLVGRFPYLVIFTLQGNEVVIVGVLHMHRDLESILRSRVGTAQH